MRYGRWAKSALILALSLPLSASPAEKPEKTPFGATQPLAGALHGRVYKLPRSTRTLPNFELLSSVGDLYTYTLSIPDQPCGYYPGIPRVDYFGIDYKGIFQVSQPGDYRFFLQSDDGAKLFIDDRPVLDMDGLHPAQAKGASMQLSTGPHPIRVSYFQGPCPSIALVLAVQPPGGSIQLFDMRNFAPPEEPPGPSLHSRPQ